MCYWFEIHHNTRFWLKFKKGNSNKGWTQKQLPWRSYPVEQLLQIASSSLYLHSLAPFELFRQFLYFSNFKSKRHTELQAAKVLQQKRLSLEDIQEISLAKFQAALQAILKRVHLKTLSSSFLAWSCWAYLIFSEFKPEAIYITLYFLTEHNDILIPKKSVLAQLLGQIWL